MTAPGSRRQDRGQETTELEQGRRVRQHQDRETANPRHAIRDRGRGAQISREDQARNNDRANARGGRGRRG